MTELFSSEQIPIFGKDLFGSYNVSDKFWWVVGQFSSNGAKEVIKYALDEQLKCFYPHRSVLDHRTNKLKFVPLWKNYLFIQYIPNLTLMICRRSSKFINFITFDLENNKPELVHRDAIDEVLRLLKLGKYNYVYSRRPFIEKGTIVRIVNDTNFDGKLVRLLCDITPNMDMEKRVPVELGHLRIMIEIRKLFI